MEKYIDVEAVRSIARDWACCAEDLSAFMSEIDGAPTFDVAPVRHAKLIQIRFNNGCEYVGCSACYAPLPVYSKLGSMDERDTKFCYTCGARMDGQAQ